MFASMFLGARVLSQCILLSKGEYTFVRGMIV